MPSPTPHAVAPPSSPPTLAEVPAPLDLTHARLVSGLAHLLFALGFRDLQTGLQSRTSRSDLVSAGTHCPDVTARSGHNTLDIFAVETMASLGTEPTAWRLQALAAAAKSAGAGFWLAVPSEARTVAAHRVRELRISARVICV